MRFQGGPSAARWPRSARHQFSFGGGTNDTTVMDFGGGVFEVLSTSGDTQTGGADVDKVIMDWLVEEFKRTDGIDLSKDLKAMARLKDAAEKAKIELSSVFTTDIDLPYIAMDATSPKNMHITVTRAKLEQIARPIVEKIKAPLIRTIEDAKITAAKIDKVILFGAMTKMPLVQQIVEETIGKKPDRGLDPMECVAMGAAIQGAIIAGEISDIVLLDVTPLSLGVETLVTLDDEADRSLAEMADTVVEHDGVRRNWSPGVHASPHAIRESARGQLPALARPVPPP